MTHQNCYVRATELIGFEEVVEGGDIDAATLFKLAGIDAQALRKPDSLMSAQSFNLLHEIAADKLKRPNIGIEWALRTPDHFPNLGPLMLLANFTESLGEFANAGLQYWYYHTNAYRLQILKNYAPGLAIFRYFDTSSAPSSRQLVEHLFANVVSLSRKVTNHEHENPAIVRFQHSQPADISQHKKLFRCELEFNAPHSEIVFDEKYLSYSTAGGLKLLRPIVGYYIRHRIQRLPIYDQSMTTTVSLAIPAVLGSGNCNVEFIAGSIGLSSKKLRRLLALEGTTFSDILDKARAEMACLHLKDSDAPVASIAGLLDYSSTPPFTLAFKRWTGKSPIEFRRDARVCVQADLQ